MSSAQHSSVSNDWLTPKWIIDSARELMGGIDLDPATDGSNPTEAMYWMDEFGLEARWDITQPWGPEPSRVWLNPPGGRGQKRYGTTSISAQWWHKLMDEYFDGRVSEFMCMGFNLNILQTTQVDDSWAPTDFHYCIFKKRIAYDKLVGGERVTGTAPPHPSCLIYSGRIAETYSFYNFGQFEDLFGQHGKCHKGARYV